mmetsp:Transcript_7800/g.22973  ORF Transcript_7800/g.22973 Transcript_7800/m.22973 type:complete len:134 (+) Transcript_7800:152-553(+)
MFSQRTFTFRPRFRESILWPENVGDEQRRGGGGGGGGSDSGDRGGIGEFDPSMPPPPPPFPKDRPGDDRGRRLPAVVAAMIVSCVSAPALVFQVRPVRHPSRFRALLTNRYSRQGPHRFFPRRRRLDYVVYRR